MPRTNPPPRFTNASSLRTAPVQAGKLSPSLPADCASCSASNWAQFLGPARNGILSGRPLPEQWPPNGPRVVWSVATGEGYSSPVVDDGRVVLCHRLGDEMLVSCYGMLTGKTNWTSTFPTTFRDRAAFDSGPRPTPAIRDGKVFFLNTDGLLGCLDMQDGRTHWSRQLKTEHKSEGTWHGFAASPLVTESAVIVPVGGTNGAGVIAVNPANGDTIWQALHEKLSASSPVLADIGGKTQLLVITRAALNALEPQTGKMLWSIPTPRQSFSSVYATAPLVIGDFIYISAWYRLGAKLIQVEGRQPREIWNSDDALSTHYANAIYHNGYLYGFHGHAAESGGPTLRCIDLESGGVMWEQPKFGSGTIVRSGENLILLLDTGELQLAKASPKEFRVISRAQIVGKTTRSYPAIAGGYAFVRGPRKLVCIDLDVKP